MQDKRYSVFISSTYEDLIEERKSVQEAVLSGHDFPIQMESFPAADVDQLEFIKPLIDESDYYILIVAGRYGTVTDDLISYTEKEYDYAKSKNIPVLVMLRGDREELPGNKMETTDRGKKLLKKFIKKVSTGCISTEWTTSDGLKYSVGVALANAKITHPRTGWLRGDAASNDDILRELTEVRKENKQFREKLEHSEDVRAFPNIPELNDLMKIELMPLTLEKGVGRSITGSRAEISCTWLSAFSVFSGALNWSFDSMRDDTYNINVELSVSAIGSAFAAELASFDTQGLFSVSARDLVRLKSFFIETGLMNEEEGGWEGPLTEAGKKMHRRCCIAHGGKEFFSVSEGEITELVTSTDASRYGIFGPPKGGQSGISTRRKKTDETDENTM